jgi:hypothetical protein
MKISGDGRTPRHQAPKAFRQGLVAICVATNTFNFNRSIKLRETTPVDNGDPPLVPPERAAANALGCSRGPLKRSHHALATVSGSAIRMAQVWD